MDAFSNKRSWNWQDTFLFFVRTCWVYYYASGVLLLYSDPAEKSFFFLWFAAIYLVPYFFYRPGMIKLPLYVTAEAVLSGSMFFFLMHHLHMPGIYEFLYLPIITIAFVCQTRPLLWIGPAVLAGIFTVGTGLAGFFSGQNLAGVITDSILFYGFGFSFGRITIINEKRKKLIPSIEEKNRMLEHYAKRIEELTIMEERNRVSRDLHDTVGHMFTSVITSLDALPFLIKADKQEAGKIINEISDLAKKGLKDVKTAIYQSSEAEEEKTLGAVLKSIADDFTKHTGTTVSFYMEGSGQEIEQNISYTLVRCLQESLTNAKRHGEASVVTVTLSFREGMVRLHVTDNGKGMKKVVPGFGLHSMKDRLLALGGTLHVESSDQKGTHITCTVPIIKKGVEAV